MPELNPAAAVVAPAPAAPARGMPSAAPDDAGEASFGAAMAHAQSKHAAKGDAEAPAEKPSTRKAKPPTDATIVAADDTQKGGESSPVMPDGEEPAFAPVAMMQAMADAVAVQPLAATTLAQQIAAIATPQPMAPGAPTADAVAEQGDAPPVAAATAHPKPIAPKASNNLAVGHAEADAAPAEGAMTIDAAARPATRTVAHRTDRSEPDAPVQRADEHRAPAALTAPTLAQRDRLSEDFQQRFERALTAVTTAAPRSDAAAVHASAAPAASMPLTQPARNDVVQLAVPTPVLSYGFAEDFSQRVALLTRGRVHSAELALTPADLGPVSVSIEVRGSEATLLFGAAHASTRSAIEEALPRLREMLDAHGLQLTDARVGTQSERQTGHDHGDRARGSHHTAPHAPEAPAAVASATAVVLHSPRLIDVIV